MTSQKIEGPKLVEQQNVADDISGATLGTGQRTQPGEGSRHTKIAGINEYSNLRTALNITDQRVAVSNSTILISAGEKGTAYENLDALANAVNAICKPGPLGIGSRFDNFNQAGPDKQQALRELRDALNKAVKSNFNHQGYSPQIIDVAIDSETYDKAVAFMRELKNLHEGKK